MVNEKTWRLKHIYIYSYHMTETNNDYSLLGLFPTLPYCSPLIMQNSLNLEDKLEGGKEYRELPRSISGSLQRQHLAYCYQLKSTFVVLSPWPLLGAYLTHHMRFDQHVFSGSFACDIFLPVTAVRQSTCQVF